MAAVLVARAVHGSVAAHGSASRQHYLGMVTHGGTGDTWQGMRTHGGRVAAVQGGLAARGAMAGTASGSVPLVALEAAVVVEELVLSARHSLVQAVYMSFSAVLVVPIAAAWRSLALISEAGNSAWQDGATLIAQAVGS